MGAHNKHIRNPGYRAGNHWNTCQRCGFDIYESDTLEEWTGLRVCSSCYEARHPQDFIRAVKEDTSAKGLVTSDTNKVPEAEVFAGMGLRFIVANNTMFLPLI